MLGASNAQREEIAGSWLSDQVGSDEFGLSGEARELGVWAARAVESGALSSVGGRMMVDPDKVETARDWASLTVLSLLSGQDAGTSAVDLVTDGEAANRGWYADQWGIKHLESAFTNELTAEYQVRSAEMAANVAALLGIPLPSNVREILYGSEADVEASNDEEFDRDEFINAEWADLQKEIGDEGSAQWQEAFDDLALLVAGEMHYWNASREGLAAGATAPDNLVNQYQAGQIARIVKEEFELLKGSPTSVGDREAWSQILGSMQGLVTEEVRRDDAQALSNVTNARQRPGARGRCGWSSRRQLLAE